VSESADVSDVSDVSGRPGRPGTPCRHVARLATLAFVTHGEDVLLLRRPAGKRFAGRWNGLGGHVEPGEDVKVAARRELREESGLDVSDLRLAAVIHESDGGQATLVFVFIGESEKRTLCPPRGFELAWHAVGGLAALDLVPDLAALLPRALSANQTLFSTVQWRGDGELVSVRVAEEG
jgi:8-oxo-dGTP diphosphatase